MRRLAIILGALDIVFLAAPSGRSATSHHCFGEVATIVGTPGNDVIDLTSGHDVVVTLGGDDVVRPREAGGPDTLCLGPGDDWAGATASADLVDGGDGDDEIGGGRGNGNDVILGGPGDDTMHGGGDNDRYRSGTGRGHAEWGDEVRRGAPIATSSCHSRSC